MQKNPSYGYKKEQNETDPTFLTNHKLQARVSLLLSFTFLTERTNLFIRKLSSTGKFINFAKCWITY